MGVALRVQVGHVVTYRASPEGSLIYTIFTKKFQKRSKKGHPPFLTEKIHCATHLFFWGGDHPLRGGNALTEYWVAPKQSRRQAGHLYFEQKF